MDNIRRKESDFQSSRGGVREFKEQVKGTSFETVTCDRERRKKTKEKMLNTLTNRKRTLPLETGMIDLTPCEDNEKSNINSDTNYSNSNTILSEVSGILPLIEIESYANVLRWPVETAKKATVFTKDNQQNMLDDSGLDFTKNINNGNSNTYDQIARTSGDINFSDLFKALKEYDKKVPCRAETPVEYPSTAGNIFFFLIF